MADNMEVFEIDCLDVIQEISNYIEQELDPGLRLSIEAHLAKCAHCTAIFDGTRNLIRLVGDGQVFELPTGFSERLQKRLQADLQEA